MESCVPDYQDSGDDWVSYHAAMEPLRKQIAATQTAATVAALSGIAITTSSGITVSDQSELLAWLASLTTPAGIALEAEKEVIKQIIADLYRLIRDNAATMTGEIWHVFAGWLHHWMIALIHIMP